MILTKLVYPLCPFSFTRRRTGTYDEPHYEKTNIFVYVHMGQPAGSKEINNTYYSKCYVCIVEISIVSLKVKTIENKNMFYFMLYIYIFICIRYVSDTQIKQVTYNGITISKCFRA